MKRLLLLGMIGILVFTVCGCGMENKSTTSFNEDLDGNPYTTTEIVDGETHTYYDYSEIYDKLDLSEYDSYGEFGEDGLMWVEKSNYTGKQYGYIDYNGNMVIPLTTEIVTPGDFEHGYAIVSYEYDGFGMGNGAHGIIDTKGNVKLKFQNHAVSKHFQSENGNIVLTDINLMDDIYSTEGKNYIYCSKTDKMVEIPYEPIKGYYSDGLLGTHHAEYPTDENNVLLPHIDVVTFYDENADVALVIDSNSSKYYLELLYVDGFVKGEAEVTFVGQDRNYYKVNVDKTGKWVTEPIQIDRDDIYDRF